MECGHGAPSSPDKKQGKIILILGLLLGIFSWPLDGRKDTYKEYFLCQNYQPSRH